MCPSRRLEIVVAWMLLFAFGISECEAEAQGEAVSLYEISSTVKQHPRAEGSLRRSAAVTLTPELLCLEAGRDGAVLRMPAFSGDVLGLTTWARVGSADSFSVAGGLTDGDSGHFVVTLHSGAAAVSIHDDARGWLRVAESPAGYALEEYGPDTLSACKSHELVKFGASSGISPHPAPPARKDSAPVQIDMLVVYTSAALARAGSRAGLEALILNSADYANLAYANSAIELELNVVHMDEVVYEEDMQGSIALAKLTFRGDGVMDEVHALRDAYDADMVSLCLGAGNVGMGWILDSLEGDISEQAFSITSYSLLGGSIFAHEVGHNMGCDHDQEHITAEGYRLFGYSRGWRFLGSEGGDLWRTVMSYSPGARIAHFSNPDISYMGTPTGIPVGHADEANCALTINTSAPFIAQNRPRVGEDEGEGEIVYDGFYCEKLGSIYNNTLLRELLPGFAGPLFDLLEPEVADLNGGADPETLTVLGNGMLDCAYELGLLRLAIENTDLDLSNTGGVTHQLVAQALTDNQTQLEFDIGSTNAAIVNGIVPGLLELCTAYITIGDEGSTGFITALLQIINEVHHVGTLDLEAYTRLPQYLASEGDADGDGATNREEYDAYAPFGDAIYVAFALDPSVFPGAESLPLQVTQYFTAEIGGSICFEVSNAGMAGPGAFEWHFLAAQGEGEVLLPLENDAELCLGNLHPHSAGTYTAIFDNGFKAQASYTALLSVVELIPSTSPVALGLGLILIAVVGLRVVSRKSKYPR